MLKTLKENLWANNPIFMQILGICSALAVTNLMRNTAIMGLGVTAVTGLSCFTISIIKDLIPRKVRMITQVLVIAFYTVIVDIILKAYVPEVSKELGPYVGLLSQTVLLWGEQKHMHNQTHRFLHCGMESPVGLGIWQCFLLYQFLENCWDLEHCLGFK